MKRLKSTSFILSFMLQPFYTNSGSAYQRDNPLTFLQHNTTTQHNTLLYFALHWKYISRLNIKATAQSLKPLKRIWIKMFIMHYWCWKLTQWTPGYFPCVSARFIERFLLNPLQIYWCNSFYVCNCIRENIKWKWVVRIFYTYLDGIAYKDTNCSPKKKTFESYFINGTFSNQRQIFVEF